MSPAHQALASHDALHASMTRTAHARARDGYESRALDADASDPRQVGEIFAAWRIAPKAMLLLGWQRGLPCLAGRASLESEPEPGGRFTRVSWPFGSRDSEAYRFLAAVQLAQAEMQAGDSLLLAPRRADQGSVLARLPTEFLDPLAFGAELARIAVGSAAVAVARFLMELFAPATTTALPMVRAMVQGFLEAVSEADGCVEMVGLVSDHCVFMQGWGNKPAQACDVILAGAGLQRHAGREAVFQRADIAHPASGVALVLPYAAAQAGPVQNVFLLGEEGIRRRAMLPEHQLLSQGETLGHIRDLLPGMRCDGETRAILTAALRPVYDGRLTLGATGHPVRLDIDLAMATPEAGSYLAGWLYDPAGVVESVHLRCTRGTKARVDCEWTRIPRADVTIAFHAEPGLPAGTPGRDNHGFAVQVPGTASGGDNRYLEVDFHDGSCGFVPLHVKRVRSHADRQRLLSTVDLHKPSGMEIVERQLAPFVSRMLAMDAPLAVAPAKAPPAWTTLIVVPLQSLGLPRAMMSQFLREPLAAHEGLLFVCGEGWTEAAVNALEGHAAFYGVDCITVRMAGEVSIHAALGMASRVSDADRILLLGPGTIGRTPGWRAELEDVFLAHGKTACVSPTVLYEDDSIRFAGSDGMEPLPGEPYVRCLEIRAGLPSAFAPSGPAVRTSGLSAACCMMPRQVAAGLPRLRGAEAAGLEQKPGLLDLFSTAGIACVWAPSVQASAADETVPHDDLSRVARLVAGWCMRARMLERES